MTSIEWTGKTWNPIVGCSKVSEGCRNCYAINQAYRNNAMAQALPREKRGRLSYYEGLTEKRGDLVEWTGKVAFVPEALDIPLKRKKPTTYFVNSMSDLFHESVSDDQLDRIFAVMALTPQHTYQVLTKRPEKMLEYLTSETVEKRVFKQACGIADEFSAFKSVPHAWVLPNVWLGVTVENQQAANDRIPLLLKTPAAVRFLSCEPLLEEVDLTDIASGDAGKIGGEHHINSLSLEEYEAEDDEEFGGSLINWVIVGGESGHNARPCDLKWIRSIVDQCQSFEVPVFVKQLGSKPFVQLIPELGGEIPWTKSTGKGGNIDEFPEDLQIREMPINAR